MNGILFTNLRNSHFDSYSFSYFDSTVFYRIKGYKFEKFFNSLILSNKGKINEKPMYI